MIAPVVRQRSRKLRQPLTSGEGKLWQILRNRNPGGHKFRRQHPVGHLIVDFYCAEAKLVVKNRWGYPSDARRIRRSSHGMVVDPWICSYPFPERGCVEFDR